MTALDPTTWAPPVSAVSCGNRKDVPRAQRRHTWLDAGLDMRHQFSGYFEVRQVSICAVCGRDKDDVPGSGICTECGRPSGLLALCPAHHQQQVARFWNAWEGNDAEPGVPVSSTQVA